MKILLLILLWLFNLYCTSTKSKFSEGNNIFKSISLKYSGPSDKSPPEIIFYWNHFDTSTLFYYAAIKVNEKQFDTLTSIIENFDSVTYKTSDLNKQGYFNATIRNNQESIRFIIYTKRNVQLLFDEIEASIIDSNIKRRAAKCFDLVEETIW